MPYPKADPIPSDFDSATLTVDNLPHLLAHDPAVKVAGLDIDGILRGKLMSRSKFLSIVTTGFGFCSVIFGWDMHDKTYSPELSISNLENGYRDLLAVVDLGSYRRIPWEGNVPMFLMRFIDAGKGEVAACPRGLLKKVCGELAESGYKAMAGAEYEFYTFRTPDSNSTPGPFLASNPPAALPSLTPGMFGYSITRPLHNKSFYYNVFSACSAFRTPIEGWHTESGPGVFEAALEFQEIAEMADRAALFKLAVKAVAMEEGIVPCFMAKPVGGKPGNSGHVHISVCDKDSDKNLLARDEEDADAEWEDIKGLSDFGRKFLAGILEGLPSIMPILAPTVNSYKRLVENFWAPVTVSWGLEHRGASIRLIAPPTSKPGATRFEIRTPGADANPHLVMAAILACGFRGVKKNLMISVPPLGKGTEVGSVGDKGERLAKTLREATARMEAKNSVAREVLGDGFVDHFVGTRWHEVREWEEAVTDWEVRRYIETV